MPAILPLAATEVCRYAVGDILLKELLLDGQFYTPEESLEKKIFDELEEDKAAMLEAAISKAALPPGSVSAFGQMKANLQAPFAVFADDPKRNEVIFKAYYDKNESGLGSKL